MEGVERPIEYASFDDESNLINYADLQKGTKSTTFEELLQRDKELVGLTEELSEALQARFA